MIERIKSALLVLLVASSLVQSYFLVFSSPKRMPSNQSEYVQTDVIGTQMAVEELLYPEQIVLHSGKSTHTVLYPNHLHYKEILKMLKGRTFDNIRRNAMLLSSMNWEQIRNNQLGVEVRFQEGVPFGLLKTILQLRGDLPLETEPVNRIWVYVNADTEEVRTFLLTPFNTYEARADLNSKNIEQMVGFGELRTPFRLRDDYYLPEEPLEVPKYKIAIETLPTDQLQKSLFIDPGNTRNFRNSDGSEIFTDGKRGLQIKPDQKWMSYSDPVPAVDSRNDIRESLNAAVQFVNQHGGWNGNFLAKALPQSQINGRQQFVFRQYYDSFPIISDRSDNFGIIRVMIQNRVVANYERSMLRMDPSKVERSLGKLEGGKALEDRISAYARRHMIVWITPAYQPVVQEGFIELLPVWALELRDGTFELLR